MAKNWDRLNSERLCFLPIRNCIDPYVLTRLERLQKRRYGTELPKPEPKPIVTENLEQIEREMQKAPSVSNHMRAE